MMYDDRLDQHEEEMEEQGPPPVSLVERVKYTALAATVMGGGLELMGTGVTGLILAGVGASAVAYFSPEIKESLDRHFGPKVEKASARIDWRRLASKRYLRSADTTEANAEKKAETIEEKVTRVSNQPTLVSVPSGSIERPVEGGGITLAPRLLLPVDELAGKAIFIAGIRRSGKTTLGARIAEELGRHLIPMLIPDLEGDYLSLFEVLPRAVIAGHPRAQEQYRRARFVGVTEPTASQLGYAILSQGYQVILDLSTYPTLEEAILVQVGCIRGMFTFVDAHPQLRVTSHVYLDEAQRYLPQTLTDSIIGERSTLAALLKAYMDIIAIGGKRGIAPVILTQRFAQVNNKIMAQTEVFFLMRQTMDNDLKRCMEYVKRTVATEETISTFRQGEGVYIGADGTQLVTQFHKRLSDGSRSHTPKAEAARRYATIPLHIPSIDQGGEQSREPIVPYPSVSLSREKRLSHILDLYTAGKITDEQMFALLSLLPDLDPGDTRYGGGEQEEGEAEKRGPHLQVVPPLEEEAEASSDIVLGKGCTITREMYEIARRLRKSGMSTGYRDLMEPFDLSEHHAKVLNKLILEDLKKDARA